MVRGKGREVRRTMTRHKTYIIQYKEELKWEVEVLCLG